MVTINMLSLSEGPKCILEAVTSHALLLFFRKEFAQLCGEYLYGGGGGDVSLKSIEMRRAISFCKWSCCQCCR